MDIRDDKELIDVINASINNGKIIEIKQESNNKLVAVEITRSVRHAKPIDTRRDK